MFTENVDRSFLRYQLKAYPARQLWGAPQHLEKAENGERFTVKCYTVKRYTSEKSASDDGA